MELEQTIQLKCDVDSRLSQIGDFKLQATGETIKAFLAFSEKFDKIFVCPLNESDSNKREPFQILHNNPDKAHNLGLGYDLYYCNRKKTAEIHLMESHFLITANNKKGLADVIKVDIQRGIDQARVVHRIQIESQLDSIAKRRPFPLSVVLDKMLYFVHDRFSLVKIDATTLQIIKE